MALNKMGGREKLAKYWDWSSGCGEAGSYDEGGQVRGEDNNLVFLKGGRNCVIENFTAESRKNLDILGICA